MDIDTLADIYVEIIEPCIKIVAFLILVIVTWHGFNVIKYGGGDGRFSSKAMQYIMASGKWIWSVSSIFTITLSVYIAKLSRVIWATVKEFWLSKS